LALLVLVGVGTYQMVRSYFQMTTDLALQHKMAHEFQMHGAPLPPSLTSADRDWSLLRDELLPAGEVRPRTNNSSDGRATEMTYDGELAAIFVLPLSSDGRLLFDPNPYTPPITPDTDAVAAALTLGSDLRTIRTADESSVRLLTYRMTRSDGPAVLQMGRILNDQERVLSQLLSGLLGLGGVSVVLLGVGSWWLAGRSLHPAQQAWERQQAFIANASHELRAPLTLMRASTEVALRSLPPDDADNRELLGDVVQECDHMTRLVEDLLLLSRLDTGRLKLERSIIDLHDLLGEVQRQVGRLAAARDIQLCLEQTNGSVWGDPTRLRQVLLIVLDNALRYTPPGGTIRVSTMLRRRHVQITVADSGAGIAPEHVTHLFERFYRVDSARGVGNGGAGLGLSIARALVEAQQGWIMITSELGRGTQVTIALPTA
jgi:signal transduction histidine kinase